LVAFVDDSLTYNLFAKSNSEFIEYLKINSLCAGISIKFTSLSNSRKYYLQALKANKIALKYKLFTLHYGKCIEYMFAEFISSQNELEDFCHPAVINLAKEDIKNNTNFIKTLKYYIYFTNSPNDAAEALCIHRNTLFYRINRIKQITNITLDNAEEILHIYYSIKLIEFNNLTSLISE
jgi:DNA-binding PucR family transcriptional regulator